MDKRKKKLQTTAPSQRKKDTAPDREADSADTTRKTDPESAPDSATTAEGPKPVGDPVEQPSAFRPGRAAPSPPPRPKVGVVLGSDGIKAFSALPLIEFLQKERIKVDMVAATGGGGLLAALWGSGYDLNYIISLLAEALSKKHFSRINYASMLNLMNLPTFGTGIPGGLVKPSGLQTVFKKIFKDSRIEDLRPRTVFTATDAFSGQLVPMEEGNLADAVYASGSIYPVMPPIKIGERQLVDGSFSDPLPIMECFKRGMDVIIAVYFDDDTVSEPEGFMHHMFNAGKMYMRAIVQSRLPLAIAMHNYEIVPMIIRHHRPVSIWDVERLKEIIHAGKVVLNSKEEEIRSVMKNFPPEKKRSRRESLEKLEKDLDGTMVIKQF